MNIDNVWWTEYQTFSVGRSLKKKDCFFKIYTHFCYSVNCSEFFLLIYGLFPKFDVLMKAKSISQVYFCIFNFRRKFPLSKSRLNHLRASLQVDNPFSHFCESLCCPNICVSSLPAIFEECLLLFSGGERFSPFTSSSILTIRLNLLSMASLLYSQKSCLVLDFHIE